MTRPTNAYEACQMAANIIAVHPHNYFQDYFALTAPMAGQNFYFYEESSIVQALRAADNVCGTVFCRSGWVTMLAIGEAHADGTLRIPAHLNVRTVDWGIIGEVLVGASSLESRYPLSDFFLAWDRVTSATSNKFAHGTEEYALEGARGLRAFAEAWRDRLERTTYVYNADGSVAVTCAFTGETRQAYWH